MISTGKVWLGSIFNPISLSDVIGPGPEYRSELLLAMTPTVCGGATAVEYLTTWLDSVSQHSSIKSQSHNCLIWVSQHHVTRFCDDLWALRSIAAIALTSLSTKLLQDEKKSNKHNGKVGYVDRYPTVALGMFCHASYISLTDAFFASILLFNLTKFKEMRSIIYHHHHQPRCTLIYSQKKFPRH